MSRLLELAKTSAVLFKMTTRLTQHVRRKTTSEHVLDLRGDCVEVAVIKKSLKQVARENYSHMNCLPVPGGCWEDCYQAVNTKRNRNLILSISALGVTLYCMNLANCFFVHSEPPRRQVQLDKEKIGTLGKMMPAWTPSPVVYRKVVPSPIALPEVVPSPIALPEVVPSPIAPREVEPTPIVPPEEAASPPEEAASPPEEAASPPEEAASPSEEAASPPEEAASPSEEAASPPEEAASPSEEAASPPEEAASPPEEAASPSDESPSSDETPSSPSE